MLSDDEEDLHSRKRKFNSEAQFVFEPNKKPSIAIEDVKEDFVLTQALPMFDPPLILGTQDEKDEKHQESESEEEEEVKVDRSQYLKDICTFLRGHLFRTSTVNDEVVMLKWFRHMEEFFDGADNNQKLWILFGEGDPKAIVKGFGHNFAVVKTFFDSPGGTAFASEHGLYNRLREIEVCFAFFKHAAETMSAGRTYKATKVIPDVDPLMTGGSEPGDVKKPDSILLAHVYTCAVQQNLRRDDKGTVYEPISIGDGIFTYCFRRRCEMKQFLASCVTPEEQHPSMYAIYIDKNNTPHHVETNLMNLEDSRFPLLVKNRYMWSFNNGVFDISTMKFYHYKSNNKRSLTVDKLPPNSVSSTFIDGEFPVKMMPTKKDLKQAKEEKTKENILVDKYQTLKRKHDGIAEDKAAKATELSHKQDKEWKEGRTVTRSMAAAQAQQAAAAASSSASTSHRASEREEQKEETVPPLPKPPPRKLSFEAQRLVNLVKGDPNAKTEAGRKGLAMFVFLSKQGYSDEDVFFILALFGRCLFPVGTDDFQVAPFIRGAAGTGKSSLLKLLGELFDPNDIGYLMSDGQSTFSDFHLFDKSVIFAMDVEKSNFLKTRLCSYITGEWVSVDRKGLVAIARKILAPMIFASNGQPPWIDQSGNLTRRFLIFIFDKIIKSSDTHLFDRCQKQLPEFFAIITMMYQEMRAQFGKGSLWDRDGLGRPILPEMLQTSRKSFLTSCSALSAFFEDPEFILTSKTDPNGIVSDQNTITPKEMQAQVNAFCAKSRVPKKVYNTIEWGPMMNAYSARHDDADGLLHGITIPNASRLTNRAG